MPKVTPDSPVAEYEVHITLGCDDAESLCRLAAWAADNGFKYTHIVLDRGVTVSQPMLTRQWQGALAEGPSAFVATHTALLAAGFLVTRLKIEAAPWNAEVPRSVDDALAQGASRYFEHHIKLLLEPDADTAPLLAVALRHRAHLSRNARRVRADGCRERFVTQRCFAMESVEAHRCLEELLRDLASLGLSILDSEEEFVVYDSNVDLDAGWIQPAE